MLREDIFESKVARELTTGRPAIVVTIVASQGSVPRHAGTHAIQTVQGFEGTVGGGVLEAKIRDLAKRCLEEHCSRRANFSMEADALGEMVCGGTMEVFCEFVDPSCHNMFEKGESALQNGDNGFWIVSVVQDKGDSSELRRELVLEKEDPARWQSLQQSVLHGKRKARLLSDLAEFGYNGQVYIEPLDTLPVLLLCGGGSIAKHVAQLAFGCGFVIDVVDDREDFANHERFSLARNCYVLRDFANVREVCGVGPNHYVAIMTRGHAYDRQVLEQILAGPARYVGMIGSRTKRDYVFAALRAQGYTESDLDRVFCPIGLTIAAETPEQIAVSIVAELLAVKGNVSPWKERAKEFLRPQ
ncbi:MAG: XdhC family protein [Desulfovibrionaceae bacterium]|nr:XdhC family protein [Desulfovibrionaceae bacterium]